VISGKYPKGYPSGITRKNNVRHVRKQMPASAAGVWFFENASWVLMLCKHACTHTKNVGGGFCKSQNWKPKLLIVKSWRWKFIDNCKVKKPNTYEESLCLMGRKWWLILFFKNLNFVILLKWWSSISICSQIWQSSEYESKKSWAPFGIVGNCGEQ
jgi:hypothetical protein